MMDSLKDVLFGTTGPRGGRHPGLAETAAKSAVRSIGSAVGREIIRGVLGSILGGMLGAGGLGGLGGVLGGLGGGGTPSPADTRRSNPLDDMLGMGRQ